MPIPRWRWLSTPHIHRRRTELALLVLLAALLQLAAGTGLAYLAGFSRVQAALGHLHWTWLIALGGVLLVSFAGYYYAYRGIFRVEDGPPLPRPHLGAVVVAGFGGFLAHGGGALDRYALEAAGANTADARMRVNALAGLEQGILSIAGCGAALAILISGLTQPPADFTVPWAAVPIPGFLIAFWAAERYRDRFRSRGGWRGTLGTLLDSVHLIRELFVHPWRWASALLGMALFWAAEVSAAWVGLAAFGLRMNATALIIGFATGMLFTRRIGPLGGAGLLALVLPLTIWSSGAPLAVAVAGVFAYQALFFWLPMPVALACLPTLRMMGRHLAPPARAVRVEVSGLETMTVPPNRCTAVAPVAASWPSPDSTTATARRPAASASCGDSSGSAAARSSPPPSPSKPP